MRESRSSGSVEGVVSNHDSYSDYHLSFPWEKITIRLEDFNDK